ncbi:cell division topological specificity factor MinE [Candidatus Legionella polyplacis]|uniref:Cell division topological specificity factor n=1 Tax=Candidatus Legionella polyplacis TaxID=2005262 RepID=A0ABZ2H096_9GAMM
MNLLNFFKKEKFSSKTAKERLKIIISHENSNEDTKNKLLELEKEIISVITKYIHINKDQINIHLKKINNHSSTIELNITMPHIK